MDREPLYRRNDTFLGICEAIGEDFDFNSNWLRALFAPLLFFSPVGAVALYAALGVAVFASRKLFPARLVETAPAATTVAIGSNDQHELLKAA